MTTSVPPPEYHEYDARFLAHLIEAFSIYGQNMDRAVPARPQWGSPQWPGPPDDWRFNTLSRSIDNLARRVHKTEAALAARERADASGDAVAHATTAAPLSPTHAICPTCCCTVSTPSTPSMYADPNPPSPMIVADDSALAAAAYESGMSAVDELRLLKDQIKDVKKVCSAVARGDLSKKMVAPVHGVAMVELKGVVNGMVDNLATFRQELSRVCVEVGTEGKLGGQMVVPNATGRWYELTQTVNSMAANLTRQIRSISIVTKKIANGELAYQIEVDCRGEVLDLKNTVNGMVARLRPLFAEVKRVTHEFGSQGVLGGQAAVPDVDGVFLELTRDVNRMCEALTDQLRAITGVATAAARGDYSQKVEIEAEGEMAALKTAVNQVVDLLATLANAFSRVNRGQAT